jgi:hypothetical protein
MCVTNQSMTWRTQNPKLGGFFGISILSSSREPLKEGLERVFHLNGLQNTSRVYESTSIEWMNETKQNTYNSKGATWALAESTSRNFLVYL